MFKVKKTALALLMFAIVGTALFLWINKKRQSGTPEPTLPGNEAAGDRNSSAPAGPAESASDYNIKFWPPLDRPGQRVTKKPFGLFVTPQKSPVQPERFRGYHTGSDFEIFPEEKNADVIVRAACNGKILVRKKATGYGGVVVQACELDGQPITVVYGHLKLASITAGTGAELSAGDNIGLLGDGYSAETDGERKHLHLSVHRGSVINLLGYVQKQEDLAEWIDACPYLCYDSNVKSD